MDSNGIQFIHLLKGFETTPQDNAVAVVLPLGWVLSRPLPSTSSLAFTRSQALVWVDKEFELEDELPKLVSGKCTENTKRFLAFCSWLWIIPSSGKLNLPWQLLLPRRSVMGQWWEQFLKQSILRTNTVAVTKAPSWERQYFYGEVFKNR